MHKHNSIRRAYSKKAREQTLKAKKKQVMSRAKSRWNFDTPKSKVQANPQKKTKLTEQRLWNKTRSEGTGTKRSRSCYMADTSSSKPWQPQDPCLARTPSHKRQGKMSFVKPACTSFPGHRSSQENTRKTKSGRGTIDEPSSMSGKQMQTHSWMKDLLCIMQEGPCKSPQKMFFRW